MSTMTPQRAQEIETGARTARAAARLQGFTRDLRNLAADATLVAKGSGASPEKAHRLMAGLAREIESLIDLWDP